MPCGILDQAACLLGSDERAILLDCHTLEHRRIHVPDDAGLLIVDSGVERSLENTAYAQRRGELEHALRLVGAARSTEVEPGALDGLDDVSEARLRHVVTENERVRRFAAALEAGRPRRGRRLLGESHASLRDDYEVSIPELDLLVELADRAGALGARLLGGGFGGSVLVLTHAAARRGGRLARRGPVPERAGPAATRCPSRAVARREPQPDRLAAPARRRAARGRTRTGNGASSRYRGCVSGPQLAVPSPRCAWSRLSTISGRGSRSVVCRAA